jgi:hypothetical protein
VLVSSSLSTSTCRGPGRNDILAKSCTFVVCVAENSIVCLSTRAQASDEMQIFTLSSMLTVRKNANDLFHFLFKTDLQNPVGLVYNESFQVSKYEAFGILEMASVRKTSLSTSKSSPQDDLAVVQGSQQSS